MVVSPLISAHQWFMNRDGARTGRGLYATTHAFFRIEYHMMVSGTWHPKSGGIPFTYIGCDRKNHNRKTSGIVWSEKPGEENTILFPHTVGE